MAVKEILLFPNPTLKVKGSVVSIFDAALRQLVDDMLETMYAADGIGLAAPQIGVSSRIFVIDLSAAKGIEDAVRAPSVFINPVITATSSAFQKQKEGCLSFPGEFEEIERFKGVEIKAQDLKGAFFFIRAEGLLAVAFQHEMDHLDGVLMTDRIGQVRAHGLRRRMTKKREAGSNLS